jgi:hypothetical protein
MARIELKYVGRGDFVVTLYHAEYCEKAAACECKISQQLRPVTDASGTTGTAYAKLVTPRSIYLRGGGPSVGVHPVALGLQQVSDAVKRGLIVEVKEALAPAAVIAPSEDEAAVTARGRRR